MRAPRLLPQVLTLIALALPAGAQIKTGVAGDAANAGSGQVGSSLNSGGITPVGALNSSVSPLSLSPSLAPTLAPPAASLNQGLVPSALSPAKTPAAAIEDKPALKAAATPPKTPPSGSAAAAPAPPGGPPFFVQALVKLGVAPELAGRLQSFLSERHPGDQDKIYHGLGHSHEVADLTARIVSDQSLSAEKKILLIVSGALHDVDPERSPNTPARVAATLEHLDKNDEARALLVDFGSRYGFTAAQVKALIMATDFSPDPIQMQAKQDAFSKAAKEAFPSEPEWGLNWGKRLAFADQSSTYVGSLADARRRVEGLAVEIRAQLEAIGKGPGPSNEVILAGSYKFLTVLKQNPLFALLPAEQAANFDGVRAYFEKRQTPEAWAGAEAPAPARAPPVSPDLAEARRFIAGIMGKRAPTEREADSLLGDWLDEKGIPHDSPRAAAVRSSIVPEKSSLQAQVAAALRPQLKRHAAMIIRLATEHKMTVAAVEDVIVRRGLLEHAGIPSDQFEHQVSMALTADELARAVVRYPNNEAGTLMRGVASAMSTRSGKSVEEVSRDGVFLYADFAGDRFLRGYASRDPDIQSHTIAFYITRSDNLWKIDGYRQSRAGVRSDAAYIESLKKWLILGGIPERDLR
ncbi:MAG: HD domain-containing protein [Elusimicrobia bacterium]|nr:HD domain-containing protein [Elusimicrobiota bacterium]